MSTAEHWLNRYERDHTHALNRMLHWMCIPVIVVAVVGLLWSIPVPSVFSDFSPALNWGTLFLMAALVYYFIISIALAIGLLPFVLLVGTVVLWLDGLEMPLWILSATALGIAGGGQLLGHAFEPRPVSPLADLNLLIIGPLWLLAGIYQRLRIPY